MDVSLDLFLYNPFWFVVLAGFSLILCIITVILLVRTRSIAGLLAEHSMTDLLASRELFYTLYRNSPVPYLLLLKDGEISLINDAATHLFGADSNALHGKNIFEFLQSEDEASKSQVDILSSKYRQEAAVTNLECKLVRGDSQTRWVLFSMFPLHASGNPHRGLVALIDITKQKDVDRAKTEFVSLASHQLRTPLASLRWNVELLSSPKAGPLTETQQKYLVTLNRGVNRMNALIDDFLSMSRLELGMLKVEPSRIVLQDFIGEVLKELRISAEQREIALAVDIDVPFVISDPRLLHHIVANLVSNAIKYTPVGGQARLRIYQDQAEIIFEISDTGLGIPQAEQGKIFSKFFRATNAQAAAAEGTGLGLYIVKLSADALGGSLSFASREGLGTAFTLRLPQ